MDYNKMLEEVIVKARAEGVRPKLLLHACCAPCSTAVLECLYPHFDVTVYFFNPNIYPQEENEIRWIQMTIMQEAFAQKGVKFELWECEETKLDYDLFSMVIKGLENEPEGGERCERCMDLRMRKTAQTAFDNGFDYFCTTLTVSPHKNAEMINRIGDKLEREYRVKFLNSDFKKMNGYLRSVKLSEEIGLYRQKYCGCEFSLR